MYRVLTALLAIVPFFAVTADQVVQRPPSEVVVICRPNGNCHWTNEYRYRGFRGYRHPSHFNEYGVPVFYIGAPSRNVSKCPNGVYSDYNYPCCR